MIRIEYMILEDWQSWVFSFYIWVIWVWLDVLFFWVLVSGSWHLSKLFGAWKSLPKRCFSPADWAVSLFLSPPWGLKWDRLYEIRHLMGRNRSQEGGRLLLFLGPDDDFILRFVATQRYKLFSLVPNLWERTKMICSLSVRIGSKYLWSGCIINI